jgi:hypothetical protein
VCLCVCQGKMSLRGSQRASVDIFYVVCKCHSYVICLLARAERL